MSQSFTLDRQEVKPAFSTFVFIFCYLKYWDHMSICCYNIKNESKPFLPISVLNVLEKYSSRCLYNVLNIFTYCRKQLFIIFRQQFHNNFYVKKLQNFLTGHLTLDIGRLISD